MHPSMGDNFAGAMTLWETGAQALFCQKRGNQFLCKSAGKLPAAAHCKPPLSELSGLKIGDGLHVQPDTSQQFKVSIFWGQNSGWGFVMPP